MLNSFRQFSGGLTTKILLVLLIASFALWGVGDMLGGSRGSHSLAKVGKQEISVDHYRRELAIESEQVRRELGASYSRELLTRLNVPQFVLKRMIQQSLLTQEAEQMGLIPDDTTVALSIRKNPAFLNRSGMFDKARFESTLRNQGVSEKNYVEQLRMQLASDKLLDALAVDLPLDNTMLNRLQSAFTQGRTITLYTLSAQMFPASAAPKEEELATFHREHAEQFTAPEYRTVSFVRFNARDAATANTPVSDQAIREYYAAHEQLFHTPEKRELEQLLYDSEEKAREAYAQVKLGMSFAEIAKKIEPLNRNALSLGQVDKKAVLENAADSIFRLPAGGFSEPVSSPFGWHIFRVVSIIPEGTQPLEKVRKDIEEQLKQTSIESAVNDTINQLEDALASGSTLAEAAAILKLKVEQAGTFDKSGNNPQGAANKAIPELDKFIDVAFKTDEKTESSVITSKSGVYYVVRVESIMPEKLRPLAEIRNEVTKAYQHYQASRQLSDLASAIDEELRGKKPVKEIISTHKLTPSASGTINRDSKMLNGTLLLPSLVSDIFSADIGTLTAPARDKDDSYILAHITAASAPSAATLSDSELMSRRKELLRTMQEEMMAQYIQHLETKYPVRIREEILTQLIEDTSDATR